MGDTMYLDVSTKFAIWLNKKFLEWQNQQGEPMTQKEFARYLGVKPTTYSGWVNGNIPPSTTHLKKVASVLGFDVYEALGLPTPNENEKAIAILETLASEEDPEIVSLWASIRRRLSELGFIRIE